MSLVDAASKTPRIIPAAAAAAAASATPRAAAPRRGRLVIENVSKDFPGSTVPALRGVSLTCEPGEFVVVVGPSGCGKSTLLNLVAGMLNPDQGRVPLDGQNVDGPAPERTMVFQDH